MTYNLHIMLRFELEQEMLAGRVNFADLPELWNARMNQYLGVTPANDAEGVLQDVHWPSGLIGYFPSYTLGNVLSAQFFDQACREVPAIPAQIAAGEFGPLLTWLREKIYRHGRKFTPGELVQRVIGGPLNAGPYLRYLWGKYQALYRLEASKTLPADD